MKNTFTASVYLTLAHSREENNVSKESTVDGGTLQYR